MLLYLQTNQFLPHGAVDRRLARFYGGQRESRWKKFGNRDRRSPGRARPALRNRAQTGLPCGAAWSPPRESWFPRTACTSRLPACRKTSLPAPWSYFYLYHLSPFPVLTIFADDFLSQVFRNFDFCFLINLFAIISKLPKFRNFYEKSLRKPQVIEYQIIQHEVRWGQITEELLHAVFKIWPGDFKHSSALLTWIILQINSLLQPT